MTGPQDPPPPSPESPEPSPTRAPRRRIRRTGRSGERLAFVAGRAGSYDPAALTAAMARRLETDRTAAEAAEPGERMRIFPTGDARRWVPIGPSVIRAKERMFQSSYPRATGRVRDLAVSPDGRRAYAATAKGGVWYTDDGGGTWAPVGGWAVRAAVHGGVHNAQACGSLLVAFADPPGTDPAADAARDFVLVGTGELQGFGRPPARPNLAGRGVLAARGPAAKAGNDPTWEPEAGLAALEGAGVFALARGPGATAGQATGSAGAGLDRVVAGTDRGLFLGTRRPAGPPHNGEFTWALVPALGPFLGLAAGRQPLVTAALWLARGSDPNGRILLTVAHGLEIATPGVFAPAGSGVAYTDDLGATFHWVAGLDPTAAGATPLVGRMSLTVAEADRVYVLGDQQPGAPTATVAGVWRIPSAAGASPTAESISAVPPVWHTNSLGRNQRDYDQTIAVDVVSGVDRVYLGGNTSDAGASLWCLDVSVGPALVPTAGVSRPGVPPAGEQAMQGGLIGDGVHADVHMIRLAGAHPQRQVWVATDGGVFVSTRAGRVNTFAPRATGLAALEVNFVAAHPTSSHFAAIGTQDNGRHSRVGDTVWEDTIGGDGGGVAFHPTLSQVIVSQYVQAAWECDPAAGFVSPLEQGSFTVNLSTDRESTLSAFYSGPSTIARGTNGARIAIGTNRVWLSDDLGVAAPNTWRVLPFPGGPAANPRSGGRDLPADRNKGVPGGAPLPPAVNGTGPLGAVITVKWANETTLLALFANGLVRWTQDTLTGQWSARSLVAPTGVTLSPPVTGAPDPAVGMLSDVAPVPGTNDFYLVTAGSSTSATADTCLFFSDAAATFFPADLRAQLPALDPAFAVVVDPARTTDVYVGTVTGVWRGVRGAGPPPAGQPWPHTWATDVNGLPQAAVQDLHIWTDPSGATGSPRLLRAAFQSRGVWELDLNANSEPRRTYLRVHARDDRRRLPTPMANPRLSPTRPPVVPFASRDIMIRPRANPATAPAWRFPAAATLDLFSVSGAVPVYQLWTFQTAFRWHHPSVNADGRWTDSFGALVAFHRSTDPALGPVRPEINRALWNAVVGGTRLTPAGALSTNPADPLAVYRAPWQTPLAMEATATEIDLLENVVYPQVRDDVAHVFAEWSTVDVLVHHRDVRPLPAGDAFVLLLWRHATSKAALLATDVSAIPAYVAAVLGPGPVPPAPAGWERAETTAGSPRIPLPTALDARMPRGVPVDVNLASARPNDFYLFLAIAGSGADPCGLAPVGLPATPTPADLARGWPYAALRLVRILARP